MPEEVFDMFLTSMLAGADKKDLNPEMQPAPAPRRRKSGLHNREQRTLFDL